MLKGKRIVILGGSAGIGLAVATLAAHEGARVIIGSSNGQRIAQALARVPGGEGHAVDLRDPAAVRALFARLGAIDHLVFTAGEELVLGKLADLDLGKARSFFELRYWGALAAVQAATPHLAKDGSIVLTSGTAGLRPHAGFVIGSSICGAMDAVTRTLAVELAPIRVNVVTPGYVDTDLWSNIPADARAQMFRDAAARLPVGHVAGPAEIAEHYLSFMRATYVTGQSLVVDGGGVLV
ncbi:MAG TPA: SDR family oxidoreductase [Kofleriaceae bacterium]|nr:SDR family oxidoreductase [Kofleriaceae bacterium]